MYLKVIPKIEGYDFEELIKLEDELMGDLEVLPESVRPFASPIPSLSSWYSLSFEVAYWRKANQIHAWFVENVQDGIDECESHEVSEDDLIDLLSTVSSALLEYLRSGAKGAAEVLPNATGGFFFGSTEYDEYYIEQLTETKDLITKALDIVNFDQQYVYYRSSW